MAECRSCSSTHWHISISSQYVRVSQSVHQSQSISTSKSVSKSVRSAIAGKKDHLQGEHFLFPKANITEGQTWFYHVLGCKSCEVMVSLVWEVQQPGSQLMEGLACAEENADHEHYFFLSQGASIYTFQIRMLSRFPPNGV